MSTTILIVDDDPIQRRLLSAAVERMGHKPVAVEDGQAALDLLSGSDGDAAARAAACLDEVFAIVAALGGLPSGEHGIGVAKRAVVGSVLDPVTLELMRAIKAQFDPAGVLNPGKLLP